MMAFAGLLSVSENNRKPSSRGKNKMEPDVFIGT